MKIRSPRSLGLLLSAESCRALKSPRYEGKDPILVLFSPLYHSVYDLALHAAKLPE